MIGENSREHDGGAWSIPDSIMSESFLFLRVRFTKGSGQMAWKKKLYFHDNERRHVEDTFSSITLNYYRVNVDCAV